LGGTHQLIISSIFGLVGTTRRSWFLCKLNFLTEKMSSTPLDVNYLQSLPDELLLPILQTLPFQDLGRLCRVSTRLAGLCRDWNFWADRAKQEFNVSRENFFNTTLNINSPQERYVEVKQIHQAQQAQHDALVAVTTGNHRKLLDVLDHLDPWVTNLSEFITELLAIAAMRGDTYAMPTLLRYVEERLDWNVDLQPALDNAETTGHRPIYDILVREQEDQLNYLLKQAARNGDIEKVTTLIRHGATDLNGALLAGICSVDLVESLIRAGANNLEEALDRAQKEGCEDVIDYLESILAEQ
jgi:hypothetical protein